MSTRHSAYHIVGKKIGHVLVLKDLGTFNKAKKYLVRCECGNIHTTNGCTLIKAGENNSDFTCSLCRKDKSRLLRIRLLTDVDSKALYEWKKMTRIVYPFDKIQKKFSLCHRWHDFFNFLSDMKEPKLRESVLKLKQGFGEYNKKNCVWLRTDDFRTIACHY